MTSLVVSIKQYNTQSRISPEISEHCSSNLAPEMHVTKDTYYAVAMATIFAPVSFCEKPIIPICNLLKWDRGSSSEHTWFPYCLPLPIGMLRVDDPCLDKIWEF